MAVDRCH